MAVNKRVTAKEGLAAGLALLGKSAGTILAFLAAGWVADKLFETAPLGLAAGVFAGSLSASYLVFRDVRRLM